MNLSWQSRFQLYRDTEHAWLAGVCAGIAGYLGISRAAVRFVALLGFVFFALPTVTVYVALAVVLQKRPPRLFANAAEEDFWRGVATEPGQTFSSLRHRYRDLEHRLRRLEGVVTSEDFELRRRFRDIGS